MWGLSGVRGVKYSTHSKILHETLAAVVDIIVTVKCLENTKRGMSSICKYTFSSISLKCKGSLAVITDSGDDTLPCPGLDRGLSLISADHSASHPNYWCSLPYLRPSLGRLLAHVKHLQGMPS